MRQTKRGTTLLHVKATCLRDGSFVVLPNLPERHAKMTAMLVMMPDVLPDGMIQMNPEGKLMFAQSERGDNGAASSGGVEMFVGSR